MSPKKQIIKTLADHQSKEGPETPIRPARIPGFGEAPEKYQRTINELLKDRLIEGFKDSDGCLAISLNSHREREIKRVLRPVWAHPLVVLLVLAAFAVVGMRVFA